MGIDILTNGNDKLSTIMEEWKQLSDREKDELLEMIKADGNLQEKQEAYKDAQIAYRGKVGEGTEENTEEELYGDKKKILENLKENCVKVEENVEYMGYKGRKVHIDLPKIEGKFGGFTFEYFVSNKSVNQEKFDNDQELENKSYSMKDVGGLLRAMNKYMQAMGVETDGDMYYEYDLRYSNRETKNRCYAGDCLKDVAGLDCNYWLSDKYVNFWNECSRMYWRSCGDDCYFDRLSGGYGNVKLFLRLSN